MLASVSQAVHNAWMAPVKILKDALTPVVDLIYPPRCPACGTSVAEQNGLCVECWSQLIIPSDPACSQCQRPFGDTGPSGGDAVCAPCLANPPRHDGIAAGAIYNDVSRKLVLAFKHGGRIALSQMLARLIAARLPMPESGMLPLLIPVPLHRWRMWRRGYNQAALLAKELAKDGHGELLVDGLVRRKATPSLGGLGNKERRKVLAGAIASNPKRSEGIRGRDVILVDDVLTSGATSDACVNSLKKAGAKRVFIACFARVLSDGEAGLRRMRPNDDQNETPEVIKTPGAT